MLFLTISGGVSAVGLGELHGHPRLGERPRLEVEILGADRLPLDAACFRLVQPEGSGDLPWLKKAALVIRSGQPKVLEIRPHLPLNEPIVELAVYLGCGHEISRQYVLLVSPAPESGPPVVESRAGREGVLPRAMQSAPTAVRPSTVVPGGREAPPRLTPRRLERRTVAKMPDRLLLSSGIDVGEPSLRLATELLGLGSGGREAKEAQREILRLEFRMLMALNEQATSQMATAEKLRNMESTLGELQQRASEFAQRVEQGGKPGEFPVPKTDSTTNQAPVSAADPVPAKPVAAAKPVPPVESPVLSEWSLYGVLLGALLGLGGWLGWKNYRERQQRVVDEQPLLSTPAFAAEPAWEDELNEAVELDLPVEPAAVDVPMRLDLELDAGDHGPAPSRGSVRVPPTVAHDSVMPAGSATVDEHFEANPVMELADIMLSFGRVKGAAQALQEYIDNNPQEALQPWIRLMDVYRMADMRAEFESVAHNLNQNFNVEIQQWENPPLSAARPDLDAGEPRPESIEDMPRIANMICDLWSAGDVVGYLYQLLRDNRGGKRQGFTLPVVDEILFLIELKETSNRLH